MCQNKVMIRLKVLLALSLVILVIGGFLAIQAMTQKAKFRGDISSASSPQTVAIDAKRRIELPELKVAFEYPAAWDPFSFKRIELTDTDSYEKGFKYSNFSGGNIQGKENQLYLSAYGKESQDFLGDTLKAPINLEWSIDEFEQNQTFPHQVLWLKKLSDKSLLAVRYTSYECSPSITWKVFAPFAEDAPTLMIHIPGEGLDQEDMALLNRLEQERVAQEGVGCDLAEGYVQIVEKWKSKGIPEEIEKHVRIAQAIADSVERLK